MKKVALIFFILVAISPCAHSQGIQTRMGKIDSLHSWLGTSLWLKDTVRLSIRLDTAYSWSPKIDTTATSTTISGITNGFRWNLNFPWMKSIKWTTGLQDSLNNRFRRGDTTWLHATGSATGFLSNIDWTTFNNKQNALSFPLDTSLTQAKVKKLIAGFGIALSPTSGLGDVTVSSDTSVAGGGITTLNGLNPVTQTFAVDSANANWGINSSGSTHTFRFPGGRLFKYSDTAAFRAQFLKNADSTTERNYSNNLYVPKTLTITGGYGINTIGDLSTNRTISSDTTNALATITRSGYLSQPNWTLFDKKMDDDGLEAGWTHDVSMPIIFSLEGEMSLVENGTQVDRWGRAEPDTLRYRYATNVDANNWSSPQNCLVGGVALRGYYPYVLKYGSTYYLWIVSSADTNLYFYSSADKINWTIGNGGTAVLTHGTGNSKTRNLYNPAVAVVNDTLHLIIQSADSAANSFYYLFYSRATLTSPSFNANLSALPIESSTFGSADPALQFVSDRRALLLVHADVTASGNTQSSIVASSALLSANLTLAASWVHCPNFPKIYRHGKNLSDPYLTVLSNNQKMSLLLSYTHSQAYMMQAHSNVTLLQLYDYSTRSRDIYAVKGFSTAIDFGVQSLYADKRIDAADTLTAGTAIISTGVINGTLTTTGAINGNTTLGTATSPQFVNLTLTGLSSGYLPYKTATTLGNSPIYTDGTKIGIGTSTLNQRLELVGGGNIRLNSGGGDVSIGVDGNTSAAAANVLLYSNGSYLVLNSKAGSPLYLNFDNTNASSPVNFFAGKATIDKDGNLLALGVYSKATSARAVFVDADGSIGTLTSSRRYKRDIAPLEIDTRNLYKLSPVSFTRKSSGRRESGLIAEDVNRFLPEIVGKDSLARPDYVAYERLPVLLLNELQKHEKRIDEQDRIFVRQAKEIADLRKEVAKLRRKK